jgi:hypothetical protein
MRIYQGLHVERRFYEDLVVQMRISEYKAMGLQGRQIGLSLHYGLNVQIDLGLC